MWNKFSYGALIWQLYEIYEQDRRRLGSAIRRNVSADQCWDWYDGNIVQSCPIERPLTQNVSNVLLHTECPVSVPGTTMWRFEMPGGPLVIAEMSSVIETRIYKASVSHCLLKGLVQFNPFGPSCLQLSLTVTWDARARLIFVPCRDKTFSYKQLTIIERVFGKKRKIKIKRCSLRRINVSDRAEKEHIWPVANARKRFLFLNTRHNPGS